MKAHVKKKMHQKMCLEMARKGYVNDESGKFVKADSSKNTHRSQLAGYRIGV